MADISNKEQELIDYKKSRWDNVNYSSDRLDILLITLSTAGLTVSMGIAKILFDGFEDCSQIILLKLSWASFVITIILNLLSQWYSYWANFNEHLKAENELKEMRGENFVIYEDFDSKASEYDKCNRNLNFWATGSLIFAIVMFVVFIAINS